MHHFIFIPYCIIGRLVKIHIAPTAHIFVLLFVYQINTAIRRDHNQVWYVFFCDDDGTIAWISQIIISLHKPHFLFSISTHLMSPSYQFMLPTRTIFFARFLQKKSSFLTNFLSFISSMPVAFTFKLMYVHQLNCESIKNGVWIQCDKMHLLLKKVTYWQASMQVDRLEDSMKVIPHIAHIALHLQ